MKKKKTLSRGKLVKELDKLFSQYTRLKDADHRGYVKCVTCGKIGHWKDNFQAGHFMSRKHYATRWDENNVKVQCKKCNMYGEGEQYKFSLYLGTELSQQLLLKSRKIVKLSNNDLVDMIIKYKEFVKTKINL